MIKFKYRYCKVHMAQYLSGDLAEVTRRRVARFIDECPECYQEYIHQRTLSEQLQRNLPALGCPDVNRLDYVWSSLQRELAPAGGPPLGQNFKPGGDSTIGYGLVMFALTVALMIPMAVNFRASFASVDLPPRPQGVEIVKTPAAGSHAHRHSIVYTQTTLARQEPLLQNTPLPQFFT